MSFEKRNMKGKGIDKDEYETIVEENSDDDFQPDVILRKRKDRELVPTRRSTRKQSKKPEVYAHAEDNECASEETYLSASMKAEDYELDSSGDDDVYCDNIVSKSVLNDSVNLHNSRMYSVFQQHKKDQRFSSDLTSSISSTPREILKSSSSQTIKGQLKL